MQENQLIQAVDIVRDKDGYWCHPAVPEDGDGAALRAWFEAHRFEVHVDCLEYEAIDHPAYVEYFDNDGGVLAWEPAAPPGPGWFTLAIYDSEDGPQWLWARRKEASQVPATAV